MYNYRAQSKNRLTKHDYDDFKPKNVKGNIFPIYFKTFCCHIFKMTKPSLIKKLVFSYSSLD